MHVPDTNFSAACGVSEYTAYAGTDTVPLVLRDTTMRGEAPKRGETRWDHPSLADPIFHQDLTDESELNRYSQHTS